MTCLYFRFRALGLRYVIFGHTDISGIFVLSYFKLFNNAICIIIDIDGFPCTKKVDEIFHIKKQPTGIPLGLGLYKYNATLI